jgi:hypothetical protein
LAAEGSGACEHEVQLAVMVDIRDGDRSNLPDSAG